MEAPFQFRVGQGVDAHAFAEGRKLIVGGIEVDHPVGLDGHSDADVLTHAIMDALLGASALGDIGQLFPDTDAAYKDADSIQLLRRVVHLLVEKGWRIVNVDATIIAQQPKFAPYNARMRASLALALGVDTERVGLKATTTERMGFTGREEGIAATAVALLWRHGDPA